MSRDLAATSSPSARYTPAEERANSATHALGAMLALAALAWMLVEAAPSGEPRKIASSAVFGVSLLLLYLASTCYHAIPSPGPKRVLRILDHIGVYLLIAGTYTPITLVSLQGRTGWALFAAIWTLAVVGIGFEALWVDRPRWLSVATYVAMGWLVVLAIQPLTAALCTPALWLVFAGGAAYTAGTLFYVLKIPFGHAIWHLFVIAGSACHVCAVALYVAR